MHLLSPVFAFIAIQLIARSLDLTLHNNTLIHTKWTGDEENIVEHKQHHSSWLRLARSSSFKISICTATLYFIRDICKARGKLKSDKLVLLYLCAILLSQSYAPEPNPGLRTPKYPCGICSKAVTWTTPAVCCDSCNVWYHKECMGMHSLVYKGLHNISWYCDLCGLPNFSSSLFDTTSFETTNRFDIFNDTPISEGSIGRPTAASSPLDRTPKKSKVKRYDKPLRVVIFNCQSVRNKKQELENLVESSNPDIIIGNESWLNKDIVIRSLPRRIQLLP